jgi:adenine-specific DNA-methyltransferase
MAEIDERTGDTVRADGAAARDTRVDVTRTELVWPGKYDKNGKPREIERLDLPFQVIERVNESRATREARAERGLTLFDVWEGDEGETFEEGWRNKLIWGDNKVVMSSLVKQFAGKIDLIYLDPPFATGADFTFKAEIGEGDVVLPKEQSIIEEKAYRDTWGRGQSSYLDMMFSRLVLMRELLANEGVIFLHVDPGMASRLRLLMDEVFGSDSLVNEIIWCYRGGGVPRDAFARKHDVILFHGKGNRHTFIPQYVPYSEASQALVRGRGGTAIDERPRDLERGAHMPDWWTDINSLQTWSPERTGFATQKPLPLLERIIECASEPGALVADFFAGSGTTLVAAEKLGRRWIGCDLGRYGIHVSRKRLLDQPDCKSFEVLNLGKYERRYWQVATFGEDLDEDGVISLFEYVAFILKLYGAAPTTGLQHLHGKAGSAFVHVGAVDTPVTMNEVAASVDECVALRGSELHVLGWEWEMGMNDLVAEEAKKQGVKLLLRQIPREVMEEQAVDRGDVQFFELAYVQVRVEPKDTPREITVALDNFVIPNPELVPDEVRTIITQWSDYVDYWAVDWDFRDDTFMQGWVTYRTRRNRRLELRSEPHTYPEPGDYAVMVKVIDVFGNDSSTIVPVSVS